ncbi:hypothetical protein V6N13_061322 [Hibiscus sabdariffa]
MKDLGEAAYILGVKIYRDRSRRLLGLSQSTYIDKVLKRFSMEESKRGFLPMRHGISLLKEMCPSTSQERERMSQIPYASAIRSIMYAMICTRPDLSYPLSMTSRYQANPGEGHWIADKNSLKYLRRAKDVFLVYGGEEELGIKGYTDASFQTDKDDSRSQSASEAAKEAVWIKKFISELGVVLSMSDRGGEYLSQDFSNQYDPKTYQEAMSSPDSEKWLAAMRSEMDSMSENQVWTLVEPPQGVKPIGCKWVFKKKTDIDGNVQTYKGQLVAKDFRQIHGVESCLL